MKVGSMRRSMLITAYYHNRKAPEIDRHNFIQVTEYLIKEIQ